MITAVAAAGPPDTVASPRPQLEPTPSVSPAPQAPTEPNLRLTIDVAPKGSELVYTLTDRTTGRIVVQLPRAAVEALGSRPDYSAGDLIGAKA